MTSAVVHLVRHGEVENPDHIVYAALPGFGLSSRGRCQAHAAAARMRTARLTAIVSSPLQRALETARVLAAELDVPSRVDPRLTEWTLGSRWAGTRWEDLDSSFPGELEAYLLRPHDLPFAPESLDDVARRMISAVADAAGNGPVAIVSHQDPIQAGRLALTGGVLSALQTNKPGHCSIVTLAGDGTSDGWRETGYWEPDQGAEFPPITSDQT